MPNPIYVWFTGDIQGEFGGFGSWPGEDDQKGFEGSSIVQAFEHEVMTPTDPQSGMVAGKRRHGAVKLVKRVDSASPRLYQVFVNSESFSSILMKWYRVNRKTGTDEHYYTTELTEAVVTSVKQHFPNALDKATENYPHLEDVHLQYRAITWTHDITGITAHDDWADPNAGS